MSKVIRPPRMQIFFNSWCQLNCRFCAQRFLNPRRVHEMSMGEYRSICNDLVGFGIKEFELSPIVGEAFLDEHILERVMYLAKLPQVEKIIIFTNLLKYKLVEEVLVSPKVELNVSVYGYNKWNYCGITGYSEYFDKFLDNFEKLINYAHRTKKTKQLVIYRRYKEREHTDLLERFDKLMVSASLMKINSWDAPGDTNWEKMLNPEPSKVVDKKRGICKYAIEDNCVFPHGDITLCGWFDITKQSIIGNLDEQSIDEIYSINSGYFKILQEQNENIFRGICRHCTIHKVQPINTFTTMEAIYGNYVSNSWEV